MVEHQPRAHAPQWAALFLVAVAAAATGAIIALAMMPRGEAPAPAMPPAALSSEIAELDARMMEIEGRLGEGRSVQAPIVPAEQPVRSPATDPAVEALATRVAELERRLEQRVVAQEAAAPEPEPVDPAAIALRMQEQQGVILDPGATLQDKLQAWRGLRRMENAWNDAVVHEMVRIGLSSSDAEVRADIWRQADGHSTHPAMAAALLQALQSDGVADVREEAAETLVNYTSRPDVRQALAYARDNDADEGVRRYAARSLERFQRDR